MGVQVESYTPEMDSVLMENDPKVEEVTGVQVEDALLKPTRQGFAQLRILNPSGFKKALYWEKQLK